MHFFTPKKKTGIDPIVEELHRKLHTAVLNKKAEKGQLTKI